MKDPDRDWERLAGKVVATTLEHLPPEIGGPLRNVPVRLEPCGQGEESDLYGLFEGDDHATVAEGHSVHPPVIRIFWKTILGDCGEDTDLFEEEIRITLLHEIGHYFGWDEDDLEERGLG
jgi:predicted Zn-dependent protease with MMP-like domain